MRSLLFLAMILLPACSVSEAASPPDEIAVAPSAPASDPVRESQIAIVSDLSAVTDEPDLRTPIVDATLRDAHEDLAASRADVDAMLADLRTAHSEDSTTSSTVSNDD